MSLPDHTADTVITLEHVTKRFGAFVAVDDVHLAIQRGEFFSLLGPSGCGKTTTLRMVAGFETPTVGRIVLEGQDVSDVPPYRRNVNMVFQHYALFPHMNVFDNVAFGPRSRRAPSGEVKSRVMEMLEIVHLGEFARRKPAQLSGGQQQRVALARAIVIEPTVLLCDEPLGALDKKLRQAMQFELKQLQKKIGVTLVYVTHDQEEALTMSDRVAVMDRGRVVQVGSPRTIYEHPATRFVSDFIGDSNLLDGRAERVEGERAYLVTADGARLVTPGAGIAAGERVTVAVRPEKVRLLADGGSPENVFKGVVESVNFQGGSTLYRIALPSGRLLLALAPNDGSKPIQAPGAAVRVGWEPADVMLLRE